MNQYFNDMKNNIIIIIIINKDEETMQTKYNKKFE